MAEGLGWQRAWHSWGVEHRGRANPFTASPDQRARIMEGGWKHEVSKKVCALDSVFFKFSLCKLSVCELYGCV